MFWVGGRFLGELTEGGGWGKKEEKGGWKGGLKMFEGVFTHLSPHSHQPSPLLQH